MKNSNSIKWLTEKADRYFPDRQLYFRTNGDVKFISVSQKVQIFCSILLIGCFTWIAVASYNYVYINQIIGEKDGEVQVTSRNYEELESQYNQLKNDIQKSAAALEHRQQYIQQVLEEESIEAEVPAGLPVDDDEYSVSDDIDAADQEARNSVRGESLEKLFVDLKRIEMSQNNTVALLSDEVDNRLSFLKEVLDKAGIGEEEMLSLAGDLPSSQGQGGPFISLENGINENVVDSSLFDDLYVKRAGLADLEMAIAYLPIATPPEKYYISSKFGVRRDPITRKWANHKGLDMAGWHKTPIGAGGSGLVVKAGRNGSFGLFVEIDHGNGFRSKYGHLSQVKVKKGDRVKENQLIGLMGNTGRSVGTHLHYEIWFNGKPIDPLKVLKAANDVQKIKQQKYDS